MTQTKDLDPESRWPHDVLFLPICILFMNLIMMAEFGIPMAIVIITAVTIVAVFVIPRVFDKMQEIGM